MICKLIRNINNLICPSMAHGIKGRVYLYNRDDISSLSFHSEDDVIDDDTRVDASTYINLINTSAPFYSIYGNVVTYNESVNGDNYTHSLNITVNSKEYSIDEVLYQVKGKKFFVIFEPKGEKDARGFGWGDSGDGAIITSALDVSETEGFYTITISYTSKYPLFAVNKANLDLSKMVFNGNYVPNFTDDVQCKLNDEGVIDGYALASYAPYQTENGLALDSDGHLCEYSGKKQASYALSSITVSDKYEIVGTYGADAVIDGHYVKIYNDKICALPSEGSISVTPDNVILLPTSTVMPISVNANSKWVAEPNDICVVEPNEGWGNTNATVRRIKGGNATLSFRNVSTNAVATTDVVSYDIKVDVESLRISKIGTYKVNVEALGGSGGFNVINKSGSGIIVRKTVYGFTVQVAMIRNSSYTVEVSHVDYPTLIKYVHITVVKDNVEPKWEIENYVCEVNDDGTKNGYVNYTYIDTNIYSLSYGQRKTERLYDNVLCKVTDAEWVEQGSYCEVLNNGALSGYLVRGYIDENEDSDTYGWWNYVKVLDTDSCPPTSTEPIWTEISRECQTDGDGNLTGKVIVLYENTNPYSDPSVPKQKMEIISDNVTCPSDYKFQASSDDDSVVIDVHVGTTGFSRKGFNIFSAVNGSYVGASNKSIQTFNGAQCSSYTIINNTSEVGKNMQCVYDVTLGSADGRVEIVVVQNSSEKEIHINLIP